MVLLEFHQPRGAAWFDDVSLTTGDAPDRNLLAGHGFEETDPAVARAQAFEAEYEQQVRTLLESLDAAARSPTPSDALPSLGAQVAALANAVTATGVAPCLPREMRDLDDVRDRLRVCVRLLAAGARR